MNEPADAQDQVFELLGNPATHQGCEVRRVDTHISILFLAGERAYKVKRAVRLPFVDFSTLERRKQACEAELAVNRPFAPEIYRRVVAIVRDQHGRLALDGRGTPVEWAVEMLRFDENQTLDHLADAGQIDADLADALGRAVAKAHNKAAIVDAEPWIKALPTFIAQNDAVFRAHPDLFSPTETERLRQASCQAFDRVRSLLSERGARGLVRRGHGDLHLGNIVKIDGRPVLFDALEFDAVIAAGDVLYDLAFLLMDLAERGLKPQANIAFNRYLAETNRTEDLAALSALPLFLSLRAAIRANVTATRLPIATDADRSRISNSARGYFEFACFAIKPQRPALVAVGGLSGTGKSLLARAMASHLPPSPGAVVLRSDVERKTLFGRAETERLPPAAYSAEATAKVYAALQTKAAQAIAAGHSVIIDAVFARAGERNAVTQMARKAGFTFHGLFLTADLPTRLARVGARTADASDADVAVVSQQEHYELGTIDWTPVDASGTPDDTLRRCQQALA